MKSEPVDPKSAPPKPNPSPLMLGLDDLLLRPSAQELEKSVEAEPVKPRISLERFQELEQCIRNAPSTPSRMKNSLKSIWLNSVGKMLDECWTLG